MLVATSESSVCLFVYLFGTDSVLHYDGFWQMMGRVNKERLGQMLGEIQRKESIEDRYAAALRGETLTGTPDHRVRGGGGTTMQASPLQQQSVKKHGPGVEEQTLTATPTS